MTATFLPPPDVIVAGGGPAGIAAALAARRAGAEVLLVERYGFLGGMVTAGLVVEYIGFFTETPGRRLVVRGIPLELLERLAAVGDAYLSPRWFYGVNPEAFKYHVPEWLLAEGVRLLCHSQVVGAKVRQGRLRQVVVQAKEGRLAISAGAFVDATGDGDLAAAAGAPMAVGRPADGRTQAVSMGFLLGGVDVERACAVTTDEMQAAMRAFEVETGWQFATDQVRYKACAFPGAVVSIATRIHGIDATRSADLTRAEIEGRRQVQWVVRFLRERIPGFERSFLLATPVQVGVRETRRVLGHYVLTAEDILGCRRFPDVVALGAWQIELHSPDTRHITRRLIPEPGDYDIPYRCLLPQGVDGLLVAGRCLSASHEAAASLRVMATCAATGQAAGAAAALAVARRTAPAELPVRDLQTLLARQGVALGPYWSERGAEQVGEWSC